MSIVLDNLTLIDGNGGAAIEGQSIWIEGQRIQAIAPAGAIRTPDHAQRIDAQGAFAIPGLMNANVHLFGDARPEIVARHFDELEDVIVEAAQVALAGGLTSVFDTWGPRRFLAGAQGRIARGVDQGARIFFGGNIVGFDGPYSADFYGDLAGTLSPDFTRRINAIWAENVGRHLMWLPPDKIAAEIAAYAQRGIDFVKYASNEHYGSSAGALLAFSPGQQRAIVDAAKAAGLTAQAHSMSVEGLKLAIEAGCALIQHANITGPEPIPEATLALFAKRNVGAVVFPFTAKRLECIMGAASPSQRTNWHASDSNVRSLIASGAPLLLANDGMLTAPERPSHINWMTPGEDNLSDLRTGHFAWLRAMEEKGASPMAMLQAATLNIARAYGVEKDLGSLEAGKLADLLLLDKNPLEGAANYQLINMVIKGGEIVDRERLPLRPILTRPLQTVEEEALYKPFFLDSGPAAPPCLCHAHLR